MLSIVRIDVQGKGGVAHSIFFESKETAKNGVDVFLITREDNELLKLQTNAYIVKRNIAFCGFRGFWGDFSYIFNFCKKRNIKIIHFEWPPNIQNCYILFHFLRLLGFKIIYTVDNVLPHERFYGDYFFYRRLYHACNHLIVHSRKSRDELVSSFDIPENKISVIPFGCYSEFCDSNVQNKIGKFRKSTGINQNTKIITMLGAVRPYKGTEDGIKAFVKIAKTRQDVALIIAGICRDNDLKERLEFLIKRTSSFAKIIFINKYLEIDEMTDIVVDSDIFLLPYKHFTGQCGILSFIYPFGKPVVVRGVGSMSEFVRDNENGFVVKEDSIEILSEKLRILVENDDLRKNFGERSRLFFTKELNFKKTADLLCNLYKKFADDR